MSTFSRAGPNLIVSDAGFSVEVLGRTGMLYREGEKTLRVESEVLFVPAIAIWADSIRAWEPPFDKEPIDAAVRAAIIENIKGAIAFCGERADVM